MVLNETEESVGTIIDHTGMFLSALSGGAGLSEAGSGVTVALALGALACLPEGVIAVVRRWHDNISEKFANIDNVVNHITA
jgi:hypothetical protein